MPYVLASGFFPPGQRRGDGRPALPARTTARASSGSCASRRTPASRNPGYQSPGSDDVYGTNVARFLADNDQPDQLVLSLYGKLAAGMTQNTFVSGEGSTIAPVTGRVLPLDAPAAEQRQQRLLPRDAAADARPRDDRRDRRAARPRARLRDAAGLARAGQADRRARGCGRASGRSRTRSTRLPTSVHAQLDVPTGFTGPLRLRLRLPNGQRIAAVTVNGRTPWYVFSGLRVRGRRRGARGVCWCLVASIAAVRIRKQIEVRRPLAEVFEYVVDFERGRSGIPAWPRRASSPTAPSASAASSTSSRSSAAIGTAFTTS